MNPFVTFLISIPLLVASILFAGAVYWIIQHGLSGSAIAMLLIFGGLFVALVYLLLRMSRNVSLDDDAIKHLDVDSSKRLTSSMLIVTYIVVIVFLAVVTKIQSARYLLGIVSLLMALSTFWSTFWRQRQATRGDNTTQRHINLADLEKRQEHVQRKTRTDRLIIVSSLCAASLNVFVFWRFDLDHIISKFDLVGLLVLWGSVVYSLVSKPANGSS